MKDYLGVEPPNDALGILQDMHWAVGAIGYFSTYALGNVISGQLWEKVNADVPGLHEQFEQGEFGALADWLHENLWQHGRKYTPARDRRADHRWAGSTRAVPAVPRGKYPLAI